MARPRSIFGLLCYLVLLYVRRRPVSYAAGLCAVVGLVGAVWLGRGAPPPGARAGALQAGVTRDGFVVSDAIGGGHRVIELDRQGKTGREHTVRVSDELRAVGTSEGTVIGWEERRKVHLARLEDPRNISSWGSSVRRLCDGVASNDLRYAVGWLESDDTVWIVHGSLAKARDSGGAGPGELAIPSEALTRVDWCGIASAEHNVAMLWRAADRLSILMCTARGCAGLPGTASLDRRSPILGFGCLRNACLIATRTAAGEHRLVYVTSSGRVKWTRPLAASPSVSVLGFGDRAFAVGYATSEGAEVLRIDEAGATSSLWRDRGATAVPALAWSAGRLLIAHHHGDAQVNDVVAAPR